MPGVLVSIVIPVRGDTAPLERLLDALPPQAEVQLIVAATGDRDERWVALEARRADVTWMWGPPGRGPQQNLGAQAAIGRWLWFVHADSRPPAALVPALRALDADPRALWGAFRFALDSPAWQARVWERGVALRVRLFDLPYGDQGIFVRAEVFTRIGGFAAIPLMEDVELVGRLKRITRGRHLTERLPTAADRWEREGWWRRSRRNVALLALYYVGVAPETLARRYETVKAAAGRR